MMTSKSYPFTSKSSPFTSQKEYGVYVTPLQIIDKVEAHLRTMSRRSKDHINCRYRTAQGEMCAIGCLIPEDKYRPRWDDHEESYISEIVPVLIAAGLDITEALARELQGIHDRSSNWSDKGFIGDFTDLRSVYDTATNN